MGEEISRSAFEQADYDKFLARLREETRRANDLFARGFFSEEGYSIGFEIEAWLLDHRYLPKPSNEEFLMALAHPLAAPELSRFNVELNCTPVSLSGDAFRRVAFELDRLWAHCNSVAHGLDANMVLIGTLPTIRDEDLTLANISPMKRYYALNNEILRRRDGRPLKIDIKGRERLVAEHHDVMLESAATSFQIHLKTPASLAHRYFNASLLVSGPILAASTNAPFLFGRLLWEETRIPLFEQAIDLAGMHESSRRVTFGKAFLQRSLLECFIENLDEYPVLLPLTFDEPTEAMRHLRLHNGTIWRWNRPLIGFEESGTPHVRIEHRILPSGPTIADMIANAALYTGLVHNLVTRGADETVNLSFEEARINFYAAALAGLDAQLIWSDGKTVSAPELLLDNLIPAARAGLTALGINDEDRDLFMDIIEARVRSKQTGAAWQRACFAKTGDFFEMMAIYCENQRTGVPVHEWSV